MLINGSPGHDDGDAVHGYDCDDDHDDKVAQNNKYFTHVYTRVFMQQTHRVVG